MAGLLEKVLQATGGRQTWEHAREIRVEHFSLLRD